MKNIAQLCKISPRLLNEGGKGYSASAADYAREQRSAEKIENSSEEGSLPHEIDHGDSCVAIELQGGLWRNGKEG